MSRQDERIATFLASAGLGHARIEPLAGDASMRRYLRLRDGGARHVLMDAPRPANESMAFFVEVTRWLRERGLSAPQVLAADLEEGLLLLEDLGDALYARILTADPGPEAELYGAAVDLLADLAAADGPPPAGTEPYDAAVLARESRLAVEWWAPGAGAPPPRDAAAEFEALLAGATEDAAVAREVTVLRDYHAENLVWLPGRRGAARVGLLDYQDALLGHAAYDLVSLLEDARRDTSEALREAMIARYLARRGIAGAGAEAFRAVHAALGAQRNLKIVGIFARLALRDGKPRYLGLIPRVWAHLERDLAHPALDDLRDWVARHLPRPDSTALAHIAAATRQPA